jgi:hypothetical protein
LVGRDNNVVPALIKSFSLSQLPTTEDEFINALDKAMTEKKYRLLEELAKAGGKELKSKETKTNKTRTEKMRAKERTAKPGTTKKRSTRKKELVILEIPTIQWKQINDQHSAIRCGSFDAGYFRTVFKIFAHCTPNRN